MSSHRTFKPEDTFVFSFPNCLKCNEINSSRVCDSYCTEDFQEACQTIQDYRNCSYLLMVCPCMAQIGHAQGLVLVKVLRQFLRARLIKHFKHFKQTKHGCPNNGQCLSVSTDKLSTEVPEQWSFGPALPLVCWVTLYFYFLWAPLPCCNLSSHEPEEFTASDLYTVWSLSPAHHSRNWQRRQGQTRSEQEPKTITNLTQHIISYLPHMLCICHLQDYFL